MYRIILIMIFLLSPFTSSMAKAKGECFYDQKNTIVIERDGDSKVVLKVRGKEGADGLFFCFKEKEETTCQGDDDSGRFILGDKFILFKSAVVLGSPDEPHELSVETSDKVEILEACK